MSLPPSDSNYHPSFCPKISLHRFLFGQINSPFFLFLKKPHKLRRSIICAASFVEMYRGNYITKPVAPQDTIAEMVVFLDQFPVKI